MGHPVIYRRVRHVASVFQGYERVALLLLLLIVFAVGCGSDQVTTHSVRQHNVLEDGQPVHQKTEELRPLTSHSGNWRNVGNW